MDGNQPKLTLIQPVTQERLTPTVSSLHLVPGHYLLQRFSYLNLIIDDNIRAIIFIVNSEN